MFEASLNGETVTVKMKRIDLCYLMIACTALDGATDENTTKWAKLYAQLKETLDDFDSKQEF